MPAMLFLLAVLPLSAQPANGGEPVVTLDPITRYFHVSYGVPASAPEEVTVICTWSPAGKGEWQAARVNPLLSQTAFRLAPYDEQKSWAFEGKILERRAAGLTRTVIFNPYPEAQVAGKVDVDFRVQVQAADGTELAAYTCRLEADNSDVVYIEDWTKVIQRGVFAESPKPEDRKWQLRKGLDPVKFSRGDALYGDSPVDVPLPQLTYPLALRGNWAIFVRSEAHGCTVQMRLSGDERTDMASSRNYGWEQLWRWDKLDNQHLVIKQHHTYQGLASAHIDYVKLVPLTDELLGQLDGQFAGERDKVVGGYFEPYSWAFIENIQETTQHLLPLIAFKRARFDIVDTQLGRFGDKNVYESRIADALLYDTFGDPIGEVERPTTDLVGRMQQYTNTLDAEVRYGKQLGLQMHANFGATSCYVGTPLEGEFSREHPEWRNSNCLYYRVPEVREHILSIYRECLELGAPGLSIDFCRYPDGVDSAEDVNEFMRELRKLTQEFAAKRGANIPILVRFPAQRVRQGEMFDFAAWAKEGLVDYLCPSNIQGRHMHFDVTPYVAAVKGTHCKLMPVVDGLSWGPDWPGPALWRVRQLYDAGCDGVYIYQADGRVLSWTDEVRDVGVLGSSAALSRWWERENALRPQCSKGIYINSPNQLPGFHGWERLRIWTEGVAMGPLEVYLDGKLVSKSDGPPYLVGTEEYESDGVIPTGEHVMRVRAKDGDGWLEREFKIVGG